MDNLNYYKLNREYRIKYQIDYYKRNKMTIQRYNKEYYKKNKNRLAKKSKDRYVTVELPEIKKYTLQDLWVYF